MKPCPWPIEALLPHAAPMILIDRITGYDQTRIESEVTITANSPFLGPNGVPAYVGIEYIAQTIAALAGLRGRERGEEPRVGFLLGTRQLNAARGCFRPGDKLKIAVTALFSGEEMGAFEGRVELDGNIVMEGRLNVYQPTDTIPGNPMGIWKPRPQ